MLQQAAFFLSGISLFGTDYSVHTTNSSEVTVWKKILTVAFLMSQREQIYSMNDAVFLVF
jgi:hypothetical protein